MNGDWGRLALRRTLGELVTVTLSRHQPQPPDKGLPKNKLIKKFNNSYLNNNDNHYNEGGSGCRRQPLPPPSTIHEKLCTL